MNKAKLYQQTALTIAHLKRIHWPPMSYMLIPSILESAETCINALEELVQEDRKAQTPLNELILHHRFFKRVTDYHENGQSKYTHPFHFKIDEHFPFTLDRGVEGFNEKFGFYPTKIILDRAVFESLNEAFVAWSWHKTPYTDQSFEGIKVCFEWVGAAHGESSDQVGLTGIATEAYHVYFICYSSAENNIEASKAVAARNLSPREEREKETARTERRKRL